MLLASCFARRAITWRDHRLRGSLEGNYREKVPPESSAENSTQNAIAWPEGMPLKTELAECPPPKPEYCPSASGKSEMTFFLEEILRTISSELERILPSSSCSTKKVLLRKGTSRVVVTLHRNSALRTITPSQFLDAYRNGIAHAVLPNGDSQSIA